MRNFSVNSFSLLNATSFNFCLLLPLVWTKFFVSAARNKSNELKLTIELNDFTRVREKQQKSEEENFRLLARDFAKVNSTMNMTWVKREKGRWGGKEKNFRNFTCQLKEANFDQIALPFLRPFSSSLASFDVEGQMPRFSLPRKKFCMFFMPGKVSRFIVFVFLLSPAQ